MSNTTSNELNKGMILDIDGIPHQVVDFQHVKPGKGGAFVRTKLKNMKINRIIEKTFNSKEPLTEIEIEENEAQYLYNDGNSFNFMDNKTYEQMSLSREQVGGQADLLKEGLVVKLMTYNKMLIGMELPTVVEYKITDTPPDARGDTASGGTKPATLETGKVIQVPFFIKQDEIVRVDTRDGQYVERAK